MAAGQWTSPVWPWGFAGQEKALLGSSEEFIGSSEEFIGSSEEFFGSSEEFFGPSEEFFGLSEEFFGSSVEFFGSAKEFFGSSEEFIGPSEEFIGSSEEFIGSSEEFFGSSEELFGSSEELFGSSKEMPFLSAKVAGSIFLFSQRSNQEQIWERGSPARVRVLARRYHGDWETCFARRLGDVLRTETGRRALRGDGRAEDCETRRRRGDVLRTETASPEMSERACPKVSSSPRRARLAAKPLSKFDSLAPHARFTLWASLRSV